MVCILIECLCPGLGAGLPAIHVFGHLFAEQFVDFDAHRFEFEGGNFLVHFGGQGQHAIFQFAFVFDEVFQSEGLVGEAHIHNRGGMAFGAGKIDETSFGQDIDFCYRWSSIQILPSSV